jgi:hypothetical protein
VVDLILKLGAGGLAGFLLARLLGGQGADAARA